MIIRTFIMLALVLSACGCSDSNNDASGFDINGFNGANAQTTFVVEQATPSLAYVDMVQSGGSPGDILALDDQIVSADGLAGKLSGMVLIVDIQESNQVFQDGITEIVFDFYDVGALVVGGKFVYPFDGSGTE
jgi:hypothetical protein